MSKSKNLGILFPEILIPDKKVNKKKWPVIACDQYTSNMSYWHKTSKIVGGAPSTLHIMIPEIYLHEDDINERIAHAKETMVTYVQEGVFVSLPQGVMLVERETPFGTRVGVMLAVDLDRYNSDHRKKPLIRATEQTVAERLPSRMKVRDGAVLESPHVMLMLNDPSDSVLKELYRARGDFAKVYDTSLMQGGGHIKGWFVDDPKALDELTDSLEALLSQSDDNMLFAVGDGNHTLASAKQVWENHKQEIPKSEWDTSPLKYALVEVVNLYDKGISMHPIHRVLFNVETPNFLRMLVAQLNDMGLDARMMYTRGTSAQNSSSDQNVFFESQKAKGRIEIGSPKHKLTTIPLTQALDKLLASMPKAKIDYIHGDEEFDELTQSHGCLGFRMEPMTKDQLFSLVSEYGVLPRKAFSLGEAQEKRYYYECRLLVDSQSDEEEPEPEEVVTEAAEPEPADSKTGEAETAEPEAADLKTSEPETSDPEETEQTPEPKKFGIFRKRKKNESL
ncbi:MAG: DUF1015 domain-containing protein [Clostridia bacterium]|jgi:uncharacterized protein (DUF1015 family)|nr:DUF1015 domain-containing protein [Clostridia bacterium]MBT7122819.1 DUF1015 domain-containing protein [Clostridia bacterium]